jgi:hypothetical protein
MTIISFMRTKQRNIRWPEWLENAIIDWGKKNGKTSFSDAVVYLLEVELNDMGYFRRDYEPGIVDTRVEESEKEKRIG